MIQDNLPILRFKTLIPYINSLAMQCDTFTGLRDLARAISGTQLSSLLYAPSQIPLLKLVMQVDPVSRGGDIDPTTS